MTWSFRQSTSQRTHTYAGDGNDEIAGGNGADTLYVQGGNDNLVGGDGTDTYPRRGRESPEQWLTREVCDLLDAGRVGLYELTWLLDGSDFQLDDTDKKTIAYAVTHSITSARQAQLYELSWPSGEVVNGPINLAAQIPSADAWPSDASERYLALVPVIASRRNCQ